MSRKGSASYLGVLLLLLTPGIGQASVQIQEIAWMGSILGANEEWIELYNDGDTLSLNGWVLTDGNSLTIPLSGTITGHSYALLERTDDGTVSDVTALIVYTGALSNAGATLTLKNENGTVIDTVIGGENWQNIGGDNETKATPQRTASGWVTGTPTPGASYSGGENTGSENDEDTETQTTSIDSPNVRISLVESTNELNLAINAPSTVFVNQPVEFKSTAHGLGKTILNSLSYTWNFGDTYTGEGKDTSHPYSYPGEYVVALNATFARHEVTVRTIIKVLPVTLALTRDTQSNIIVTNTSPEDIDLTGYTLKGTSHELIFPEETILLKNRAVTIKGSRVGPRATLRDQKGDVVAFETVAPTTPIHITNGSGSKRENSVLRKAEPTVSGVSNNYREESNIRENTAVSSTENASIPVYTVPTDLSSETGETRPLLIYGGLFTILALGTLFVYRKPSRETEE